MQIRARNLESLKDRSYYIITSHAAEFFEVGAYTVDVSFIFVQHEERLKEF